MSFRDGWLKGFSERVSHLFKHLVLGCGRCTVHLTWIRNNWAKRISKYGCNSLRFFCVCPLGTLLMLIIINSRLCGHICMLFSLLHPFSFLSLCLFLSFYAELFFFLWLFHLLFFFVIVIFRSWIWNRVSPSQLSLMWKIDSQTGTVSLVTTKLSCLFESVQGRLGSFKSHCIRFVRMA